jgi:2-oxoglutarate ferredoxin oxidoreductase subunit gamma
MMEEIICAGFGGQGILLMGKLLAYSAMKMGRHATWLPSYGAEVRGGTAHCMVVVSEEEIASPLVNYPSSAIIMNNPSWIKFTGKVQKGGLIVVNTTLAVLDSVRDDVRIIKIPATDIASELGNVRVSNMVALGRYLAATNLIPLNEIIAALRDMLPEDKKGLLAINEKAVAKGWEWDK